MRLHGCSVIRRWLRGSIRQIKFKNSGHIIVITRIASLEVNAIALAFNTETKRAYVADTVKLARLVLSNQSHHTCIYSMARFQVHVRMIRCKCVLQRIITKSHFLKCALLAAAFTLAGLSRHHQDRVMFHGQVARQDPQPRHIKVCDCYPEECFYTLIPYERC